MNTSSDVAKQLQSTIESVQSAHTILENLIAVHDYQDVASLLIQSAEALLEAAKSLMQSDDETALNLVEQAEDLIDEMYKVIDGDLDL